MRGDLTVAATVWDAWAVTVLDDGSTRPATENEILQRGYMVMGRDAGVVYVKCVHLDHSRDGSLFAAMDRPPGSTIRKVSAVAETHRKQMRREMPEAGFRACSRARVFRRADGESLRAELEQEERPGRGRRALRAGQKHDHEAVGRARQLARDPSHPAQRREVSMAEIEDGDVVEELELPSVRIQGECDR